MRSPEGIQHKLKQVLYRHLQRRLRDNFREHPTACVFNVEFGDAHYGFCTALDDKGLPRGILCDARCGGVAQVRECPQFQERRTRQQVQDEFRAVVQQPNLAAIAAAFPDAAALMWVLGADEIQTLVDATIVDLNESEDE